MELRSWRRAGRAASGARRLRVLGPALLALCLTAEHVAAGTCASAASQPEVAATLAWIEASVDPCGESAEVLSVLREYRRCAGGQYPVCVDLDSERNFIERPSSGKGGPTKITWNPELRTELESTCGGNPRRPILRDPAASLLHEVVHAVQDCRGREPAENELEAIRIENIYRRARGLCQRTRYGELILPAAMVVPCEPERCLCRPPAEVEAQTASAGDAGRIRVGEPGRAGTTRAGDTSVTSPHAAR